MSDGTHDGPERAGVEAVMADGGTRVAEGRMYGGLFRLVGSADVERGDPDWLRWVVAGIGLLVVLGSATVVL